MPPEPVRDVVVVGAGPAGSSTALRFARAGFRVALVEPETFPRFKACGEFMSPDCLPILEDLGVGGDLRALGARAVGSMTLFGHGRRAHGRFVDVGAAPAPAGHGWAVRRELFDDALLRAALSAGVELVAARVTGLERGADGEVLGVEARGADGGPLRLRARLVVGADGLRSRVARELGVVREVPWLDKLALTTRYAGVDWNGGAEVHFLDGAYFACTAVDGGLVSLNLVLDRARFLSEGRPRDEALESWLARVPALGERLARGRRVDPVRGLGPLARRTTRQTFDGAALVGDAAGYVDPVTGEGIWFALEGARILCDSTVPALHGAGRVDHAALAGYRRARGRVLAPRAAFAALLQRGLRHPRLVRGVLGLLEERPWLADVLVSVTGDYVPFRELVRPRTWLAAAARVPARRAS